MEAPSARAVSIIVPTYREAGNLPELVQRLERVRDDNDLTIELIIVDDNSKDGTEQLVASLDRDWIRLIVRREERGLSSAVLRGLNAARHDTLIVMDADLSHPPEAIGHLLAKLEQGADFVIGSRYAKGGSTDGDWGMFRWFNSKVATWMARPLTRARDPMSGFFALKRATYQGSEPLNPIGYKIGLELLVKCRCRRVEEVPIHFADRTRGESKLSVKEQLRYIRHLGRLFQYRFQRGIQIAAMLLVLAAFLIPAISFMHQQSYFVDETTQLSGLTLGPIEVTRWLAGQDAHRFGVPPDRMPPMSYWVGWVWSQAFGLSELTMRWLGVLCVGLAVIVIFQSAYRTWGVAAAAAAGLLAALSPNAIVHAADIRAYPLLLLWSACGFGCLLGVMTKREHEQGRWLAGLTIFSVLAMYTHFFGVVLAGSLLGAAVVLAVFARRKLWPVLTASGITALAALGLWPFVTAAFTKSGGNAIPQVPSAGALVKYMYRGLFGHPAMTTNVAIAIVASIAFLLLLVLAAAPRRRHAAAAAALWIALLAGMTAALAGSLAFSAFDGLQASYNIWRLPAFALLVGSAVAVAAPWLRKTAMLATATLLAASAFGCAQLMFHGEYFANGPHRRIANLIERLGPSHVAVIHDEPIEWGEMYFPIHYAFGETVEQYRVSPHASASPVIARLPASEISGSPESVARRYVVLISSAEQYWSDIAHQIARGDLPLEFGPSLASFEGSAEWKKVDHQLAVATRAAELYVFERVNAFSAQAAATAEELNFAAHPE